MRIIIDGESFTFDDGSEVKTEAGGYDLNVEEPDFDRETEEIEYLATSNSIKLPLHIEAKVKRNHSLLPCSKVFKDSGGRLRLYTSF